MVTSSSNGSGHSRRLGLLLGLAGIGCGVESGLRARVPEPANPHEAAADAPAETITETSNEDGTTSWSSDVVGVGLVLPDGFAVLPDEVLFDHGYGFMVYGEDLDPGVSQPHDRLIEARVTLLDRTDGALISAEEKRLQYVEFDVDRTELALPDGKVGHVLTGLPGVRPYSVVYLDDSGRTYEIGLWSDDAGIDADGLSLLEGLSFREPTVPVASLGLVPEDVALYRLPSPEIAARSADLAQRKAERVPEIDLAERNPAPPEASLVGCGIQQPDWLLWQLQWDDSNAFYSGDWYTLKNRPRWSAMSGNYGSWWGTNFHVNVCSSWYSNQHYANDWPAYYWDNAYSAFAGTVEWAAWGNDGFASLGRYVVVNNGYGYRSTTAHLSAIPSWIYWGAPVGLATVIGYAGDSGEYYAYDDWAPHLHARVVYGEYLTWYGEPYGGDAVWPIGLRCWTCNDPDVWDTTYGGWYTSFWHGRWMRN